MVRLSALAGCILLMAVQTRALYFYLQVSGCMYSLHARCPQHRMVIDLPHAGQAGETRCFLEELPRDTIVVGHYKAEEWTDEQQTWIINDRLGIQITVDVGSLISGLCSAPSIQRRALYSSLNDGSPFSWLAGA